MIRNISKPILSEDTSVVFIILEFCKILVIVKAKT